MWLILLEASLRSIGEHRGDPTFKTFTARTREKYRKRFENLVPNSTTICIDVVSNVLHQLGARNAGPAATTRASILHGIDARFGSRRQSLQLIALLYAVWMLVLETEEQIAS
jgi:hypothetical protein